MSTLNDVTCIIKSFKRPQCVEDLYFSIREYYPEIAIAIVDDSESDKFLTEKTYEAIKSDDNVQLKKLDFDVGLSVGRNEAVALVRTKYFVLLDDDFVFLPETKLERFLEAIDTSKADMIGGLLNEFGTIRSFCTIMNIKDNVLYDIAGCYKEENGIGYSDKIYNFFIANTESVRNMGGWDPQFKLCEHTEFFLRAKEHKLVVGCISDVIIGHTVTRAPDYDKYRIRGRSFQKLTALKFKYHTWVQKYTKDNPTIIKY